MPSGTNKTVDIREILSEDNLACHITELWCKWDQMRQSRKAMWQELRNFVFATDTSTTTNRSLPWKNSTTTPKLCQIRDNLFANYKAAVYPKQKFLDWIADVEKDEQEGKRTAIKTYINWCIERGDYESTLDRLIYDWEDYGDTFVTVNWRDDRVENANGISAGYVGPVIQRISPYDIVFDPTATSFTKTPKIVRSFVQMGEVEAELAQLSTTEEQREEARALMVYMRDTRQNFSKLGANDFPQEKELAYQVDGFSSFFEYMNSGYVEVLTFYGDLYDMETGTLYKNYVIKVVDRHKILYKAPNDSVFGHPPIWKCGWRTRPDNLWSMGPLDNLIGLQYRIDHMENMKADLMDLTGIPPLKIKGYVEDFEWGPMEPIYVGDDGDVELMTPRPEILQYNLELNRYTDLMEEMAGAPKEAMGFRTPGEKTMYEVQRLENAASRIFQSKIMQFEREIIEPSLNGMLELARRKMDETVVRVFNESEDIPITEFMTLSAQDITGMGRLKPVGARHFAQNAELVQNLNNFFASALGADPEVKTHFSTIKLAKMFEDVLNVKEYKLVTPFIRISEQAQAQSIGMAAQEQTLMAAQTPSGLTEDDTDVQP